MNIENESPEEREAFERMQAQPTRAQLIAEVAVLTELVRVLSDRVTELEKTEQEPVAWLHTKIEGLVIPHQPADLNKHPNRWEALYKTPPPCPTCEALSRTVMLDQTSYDTTPQRRKWVGLTADELNVISDSMKTWNSFQITDVYFAIEAKLKEKNT